MWLCADCDHFIHLRKTKATHARTPVASSEPTITLTHHEDCTRLKMPHAMVVVECTNVKAIIDLKTTLFRSAVSAICRFCARPAATSVTGNVCDDDHCKALAALACIKTLECGHACGGVVNESVCLPCLQCPVDASQKSVNGCGVRTQDHEDQYMICFSGGLSEEPCADVLWTCVPLRVCERAVVSGVERAAHQLWLPPLSHLQSIMGNTTPLPIAHPLACPSAAAVRGSESEGADAVGVRWSR